jgi:Xaa-Pro aminopeptidase
MSDLFSADFYVGNRKKLRSLFQGTAPVVITANGKLQKGTSDHFPLYQDGNFLYLTGINEPDLVLVMDKDKEYLILPERSQGGEAFYGVHDPAHLSALSGVAEVLDFKSGWKKLTARLKKVKHVATVAPSPVYIEHYDFYTNPARATLLAKLKDINPQLEPLDLRQHLAIMRMVKQAPEVAAIQRAIDISIQSFKEVRRKLPKVTNEYEVAALLGYGFRRRGADGEAYFSIVAGGANACVMHYDKNNQLLGQNQVVMIDAGAAYNRYAADISRSYIYGTGTKRQDQVWQAVKDVHDFALANLKPGVTIIDNERAVEQFMGEKLRSLGLIRNVERGEIRKFFPHATSHYLGLDVHDAGDYQRPLEPGVTLTVEPGIYIPAEGIGIRLEDDLLITADGATNLSAELSLDL